VSDLFDDIVPATTPLRRWVDHHQERRGVGRPSPNGRVYGAFKHVCASCGREFDSNRRQLPGKRSWCGRDECKKEAAALRARDYRDRKAKETP
jgi:hypothetical protein